MVITTAENLAIKELTLIIHTTFKLSFDSAKFSGQSSRREHTVGVKGATAFITATDKALLAKATTTYFATSKGWGKALPPKVLYYFGPAAFQGLSEAHLSF
jgi:hypothetical protein